MIAFRVDANEHIAMGHLMRCIAIANGFRKKGERVLFILAEEKETMRLKQQGIPYIVLHSNWNELEQELLILREKLREYAITKLIVDSYQATTSYLESVNQWVKVIYMDDMSKDTYPVAGVIHYSNWPWDTTYAKRYENLNTVCMVGMKYIPLREEFYPVDKECSKKNVLVTTGGTDQYNVAGNLLKYIKRKKEDSNEFDEVQFFVVSGSMNKHKAILEKLADENSWITLYENANNMGELMRSSYLAVSAGGTTLYELCACKVPTISFSFADNQEGFTEEMGQQGILYYAGDVRKQECLIEIIYDKLIELWNDEKLCEKYREKMGQLVDGKGVERIVDRIMEL